MPIWKTPLSLELLQERNKNTLAGHLQIAFTEIGDDFLRSTMPVSHFSRQPFGILHGGASCALAETVGSTAGNLCVDLNTHYCVGLELNINHLRPKTDGFLIATASAHHLGKKTQVWMIDIRDEQGAKIAISRHTVMVLPREKI